MILFTAPYPHLTQTFGRSMTFDMACDIWRKTVKDTDFTCIELVYGHAGTLVSSTSLQLCIGVFYIS